MQRPDVAQLRNVASPGPDRITLYEGLPHQKIEREQLAEEKKKPTVEKGGFPFYRDPLTLKEADAKALSAILGNPDTFQPFRGEKRCNGFHPDYALVASSNGEEVTYLICFGCGEAKVYGPDLSETRYDLNRDSHKRLGEILKPYQKNRPARSSGRKLDAANPTDKVPSMRWPRPRFTMRWMMIVVAIIAVAMGIEVMRRRHDSFRRNADFHAVEEKASLESIEDLRRGARESGQSYDVEQRDNHPDGPAGRDQAAPPRSGGDEGKDRMARPDGAKIRLRRRAPVAHRRGRPPCSPSDPGVAGSEGAESSRVREVVEADAQAALGS